MSATAVRLGELAAVVALAQDHAFGQPPGSQLRACLLGQWLAADDQVGERDTATTYWLSLLRFLGCTGHAHEVSVIFGDEIEARSRSLLWDASSPAEVLREIVSRAGAQHTGLTRIRTVAAILAGGRRAAEMNFRTGCEVADVLSQRLGVSEEVRQGLAYTFERWNGRGLPKGVKGADIPLPMRIVHLCQEAEVLSRVLGLVEAMAVLRARSGKAYDPDLVDALVSRLPAFWERLEAVEPWDEVLAAEPSPRQIRSHTQLDDALGVLADFADLKSPYTGGHSRAVAALAAGGAEQAGMAAEDVAAVHRAGLVHDVGRVGVPNSIWDKPAALTRGERDKMQSHTLLTEQLLRNCPALAPLEPVASAHHERLDGSGYHRRCTGAQLSKAARLVAAADCYQAMTEARAHRSARPRDEAAAEVRAMARAGGLDPDAVDAVLAAAGHRVGRRRTTLPAGLTAREVEVLRLVARGMTTRQISERLVISPKTTEHHVEHIYTKIGVSTRGAAALFAIQHDLATDA